MVRRGVADSAAVPPSAALFHGRVFTGGYTFLPDTTRKNEPPKKRAALALLGGTVAPLTHWFYYTAFLPRVPP